MITARAAVETGHFLARDDDGDAARALLAEGPRAWPDGPSLESADLFGPSGSARAVTVRLQGLRWLDVLRRTSGQDRDARASWSRWAHVWCEAAEGGDLALEAWSPFAVVPRAVTLALGADLDRGPLDRVGARHLEALREVALTQQKHDLVRQALDAYRFLGQRLGVDEGSWRELVVSAVEIAVDEDGFLTAEDTETWGQGVTAWVDWLRSRSEPGADLGVLEDRLREPAAWIHLTGPDGLLVAFGDRPGEVPGAVADPALEYARSLGARGRPPAELALIGAGGVFGGRSGWGETERDLERETQWTLLGRSFRGGRAHQHLGRLTLHGAGRPWLIDPPDQAARTADLHSIVVLDEVAYRPGAVAVRGHAAQDGDGSDVSIDISAYARTSWRRRVVHRRAHDLLVVVDSLRSPDPMAAWVTWMIDPDAEIRLRPDGADLVSDGKHCGIVCAVAGADPSPPLLDEVRAEDGRLLARRLRFPVAGSRLSVVTAITLGDRAPSPKLGPISAGDGSCTLGLRDSAVPEMLVLVPGGVDAVDPAIPARRARNDLARSVATGGFDEQELRKFLATARTLRLSAMRSVREAGGSERSRLEALDDLRDLVEGTGFRGHRDAGLAATMVDLAGADLISHIEDVPLVRNRRRGPLVSWAGRPLVQPFYGVPVATTDSPDTAPSDGPTGDQVWSTVLDDLVPAAFLHDEPGDTLLVALHGAMDRQKIATPRFERMRGLSSLHAGPVMSFCDPGLDLDASLILGWYLGTPGTELHRVVARMITAYAAARGVERVMLTGNSGGGFAALQVASHLQGADVIAFNPQVTLSAYLPRLVSAAHEALFDLDIDSEALKQRSDALVGLRDSGFGLRLTLVQNTGDHLHHQDHAVPLVRAFQDAGAEDRLRAHFPDLGPGHRVPPPAAYLEHVAEAVRRQRGRPADFQGVR